MNERDLLATLLSPAYRQVSCGTTFSALDLPLVSFALVSSDFICKRICGPKTTCERSVVWGAGKKGGRELDWWRARLVAGAGFYLLHAEHRCAGTQVEHVKWNWNTCATRAPHEPFPVLFGLRGGLPVVPGITIRLCTWGNSRISSSARNSIICFI